MTKTFYDFYKLIEAGEAPQAVPQQPQQQQVQMPTQQPKPGMPPEGPQPGVAKPEGMPINSVTPFIGYLKQMKDQLVKSQAAAAGDQGKMTDILKIQAGIANLETTIKGIGEKENVSQQTGPTTTNGTNGTVPTPASKPAPVGQAPPPPNQQQAS